MQPDCSLDCVVMACLSLLAAWLVLDRTDIVCLARNNGAIGYEMHVF